MDGDCFIAAFDEALGIADVDPDWGRYDHTTDPGIAAQVFRERRGREPVGGEIARLQSAFLEKLAQAARGGGAFAAIPGAAGLIAALRSRAGWTVALATGGWRAAALLKIGCSGLDLDDLPAAYGEDGPSRQNIVRAAISRARGEGADFTRIVCIGDEVWDVRTSRGLGYPCIGVATGKRAARLAAEGASHVVADFQDQAVFLKALEDAAPVVRG